MAALKGMADGAILVVVAVVVKITQANPHVAMHGHRHGNGDAETHDAMRKPERIDIAVAQKENARYRSPEECHGSENGLGAAGDREDHWQQW